MFNQPDFPWNFEQTDTLRRLWTEGSTGGQIAAKLGTTRNAVMGKIRRMKLPLRGAPGTHTTKAQRADALAVRVSRAKPVAIAKPRSSAGRSLPPMPIDDEVDVGVDVTKLLGIMDLTQGTCRWPVTGQGSGTLFCGQYTDHGPYCLSHRQRAGLGYGKGPRP